MWHSHLLHLYMVQPVTPGVCRDCKEPPPPVIKQKTQAARNRSMRSKAWVCICDDCHAMLNVKVIPRMGEMCTSRHMRWCHEIMPLWNFTMPLVGSLQGITCLLWWTKSLFDLGLDLCCTVLHEDCAVWITLGHLLLALHTSRDSQLSQALYEPWDPHKPSHSTPPLGSEAAGVKCRSF